MQPRSNRLVVMDLKFKKSYKAALESLQEKETDARLFVNIIDLLKTAVQEFEALNIQSAFIKVAFAEKYRSEMDEISQLEASLKLRKLIA